MSVSTSVKLYAVAYSLSINTRLYSLFVFDRLYAKYPGRHSSFFASLDAFGSATYSGVAWLEVGRSGPSGMQMKDPVVFHGTSVLNLDAKGRMAIPAKYREQLVAPCGGRMTIAVDRDRCLLLYPMPARGEVEAQLNQFARHRSTCPPLIT